MEQVAHGADAPPESLERVVADAQAALERADAQAITAAEPDLEIAYLKRSECELPEPDHAARLLREADLAIALDTIRKAIETIDPGALPLSAERPRAEAAAIIAWITRHKKP